MQDEQEHFTVLSKHEFSMHCAIQACGALFLSPTLLGAMLSVLFAGQARDKPVYWSSIKYGSSVFWCFTPNYNIMLTYLFILFSHQME